MKCPFCNAEMKEFIQKGYAPANVPDRVYHDHPNVKCEHGSVFIQEMGWKGHTKSENGWMVYYHEVMNK